MLNLLKKKITNIYYLNMFFFLHIFPIYYILFITPISSYLSPLSDICIQLHFTILLGFGYNNN